MTTTFKAHFDGKTLVPDGPVDLPTGTKFTVRLEPEQHKATTLAEQLELATRIGFDKASIAEMNRVIEEGCERVDEDGW